jgi:hypothetical protein
MKGRFFLLAFLILGLSACSSPPAPIPASGVETPQRTNTTLPVEPPEPTRTWTITSVPTATQTPTATSTPSPSTTITPSQTPEPTLTPVPTYLNLRGKVIIEQAVCHYGPGKPYLYKYGVYQGSNLEIIGRDEQANYLQVQAIGGNNPCWVKGEYLQIKGNPMDLKPVNPDEVGLPWSPYYGPLTGVSARRTGNEVTISWNPLVLRAGDDSEQIPYVVEAWVCREGKVVFTPLGSYVTSMKVIDESDCTAPSSARVFGAEKHGYTKWVAVPWPPFESGSSTPEVNPTP